MKVAEANPAPAGAHAGAPRLAEVIAALSHALDLTEGQPVGHAQRTCAIGMELGERLDLPGEQRRALLYALLLKDAGCSSSAARMTELFAADDLALKHAFKRVDFSSLSEVVAFAARHTAPGSPPLARAAQLLRALRGFRAEGQAIVETRCERGANVVAMLGCPPAVAEAVRALDEHWDGSGRPRGLTGDAIPLLARIACLAQVAEVFHAADGREAAREVVRARRGRWFDPEVADAFLAIRDGAGLWRRLADGEVAGLLAEAEDVPEDAADEARLDLIAEAFAEVIDAKSPYTASHSEGVAAYAVAIGERLGMGAEDLRSLRRAGLLHDIGKLGVSNAILDKPGRLTPAEVEAVRRHPRHTFEILSRVSAFADIAAPAAAHHERLDGRGYHLGLAADRLGPMARALAVADVYEALTADRPYRAAMEPERALGILRADAGTAFDGACVAALGDFAGSRAQP